MSRLPVGDVEDGLRDGKFNVDSISRKEPVMIRKGTRVVLLSVDYPDNNDRQLSLLHLGMISRDNAKQGLIGDPTMWNHGITLPNNHDLVLCIAEDYWNNINHFGVGAGTTNGDGDNLHLNLKTLVPAAKTTLQPLPKLR